MNKLSLTLLTRAEVPEGCDPLALIWDLDNWKNSLSRVRDIRLVSSTATYQHFFMLFEAGYDQPDTVEIERWFSDSVITVKHLVPPPGILSLEADWWVDDVIPSQLFSRRKIILEESAYSPSLAKKMFLILRENITSLTGNML
ncbi:hypothetical protein [Mixta intestinalis]|uniref:Uncharacterized protein n=1 Tax=Mixta intestinalis TaxID=1615494 RepID=A0A6P1Q7E1_9GAMM|nr:hypothetical protein [Mixta intestinalis]QHM73999.1 hypothetical protein C7M51_04360 [Mixta intestinalis]